MRAPTSTAGRTGRLLEFLPLGVAILSFLALTAGFVSSLLGRELPYLTVTAAVLLVLIIFRDRISRLSVKILGNEFGAEFDRQFDAQTAPSAPSDPVNQELAGLAAPGFATRFEFANTPHAYRTGLPTNNPVVVTFGYGPSEVVTELDLIAHVGGPGQIGVTITVTGVPRTDPATSFTRELNLREDGTYTVDWMLRRTLDQKEIFFRRDVIFLRSESGPARIGDVVQWISVASSDGSWPDV